jgi:hypothetical protein
MTTDRRLPAARADADSLAELIADARAVALPPVLDLTAARSITLPPPRRARVIRIPESTASLVAGYGE